MGDSRRSSSESVKSAGSDKQRRMSLDTLKKACSEGLRRASVADTKGPHVEATQPLTEATQGPPVTYAKSKFSRKPSVQGRNTGWKSSRERFDSTSSAKSDRSDKAGGQEGSRKVPPPPPPRRSSISHKDLVKEAWAQIAGLLQWAGVEEDVIVRLQE